MRLALSPAAEVDLERLQQEDRLLFDVVIADLQLIEQGGLLAVDVGPTVGSWVRIEGSSGRSVLWIAPHGDDSWIIESLIVS